MVMNVADRLNKIQQTIGQACQKSNRNIQDITIIGVTKYVTIERAKETIDAGVTNLGENRLDEFLEKYNAIGQHADWHFIGTLQSRKVKDVVDKVVAIHSLDRMSLAKEINKRASKLMDCFVQVNVSGEATKHGLAPADLMPFIEKMRDFPNIHVIGLMTMAPYTDDEHVIRQTFKTLASLRDEVRDRQYAHAPCKYLSMGMSNDYRIAVEEGATHIRIGSELVGKKAK